MVKGWIAKSLLSTDRPFNREGELHVYSKVGKEIEWHEDDWPPVEVSVFEAEKVEELKQIIKDIPFLRDDYIEEEVQKALAILEGG